MLNTLRSQKALIAENIKGEEQRTGSERERLTALIRGLEAEMSQLQGQIELQTERLKVVESDFDAADQLRSKGFMSAVDFKRRQIQVLEQKQAISALNQQLAARKNQAHRDAVCASAVADRDGAKGASAPQRPRIRGAAHRRDQRSPRLRDQSPDNRADLNLAGDGRPKCRSTAPPA